MPVRSVVNFGLGNCKRNIGKLDLVKMNRSDIVVEIKLIHIFKEDGDVLVFGNIIVIKDISLQKSTERIIGFELL